MHPAFARLTARKAGIALAIVAVLLVALSMAAATPAADATTTVQPTPTAESSTTGDSVASTDPSSSGTTGGGGSVNNEVVVLNITDGRFANRAGFGIARVTGGDVTNTNSAAATSSCSDCRTVAVAVQIVLVMGDSDYIAPRNQAVAINNNCLRCQSFALAYQYVVSTGGIVHFTSEGQQKLAGLEEQVRELTGSDLLFLELEEQVDELVERMWDVVDEEVVKVGLEPQGSASKDSDRAEDHSATSASPTASPLFRLSPTG